MNAEQLLAHFDRVADTPDAIPRMRSLVLDLAMRGRLVEQDPDDAPAAIALLKSKRALAADTTAVRRGGWKPSAPFTASETIAELPRGWVRARVNDTGFFINGLAFKPSDWRSDGLPIIRIQNLTDRDKPFNYACAAGDYPDDVIVRPGDVLVSWSATLDAFVWDRGEGVLNQHIFRVKPAEDFVDRRFLLILLRHAIRDMAKGEHAHGLVMAHINRGPFLNHVVAAPSLTEQHRIVAKVDELMTLCDELEAAQTEREQRRDRLAAASLHRLNHPNASDGDAFRKHARFHLDHLSRLTTRRDQLKPLRETILNLAVHGRLVAQDPKDEPVSVILALNDDVRRASAEEDRRADAETQVLLGGEHRWAVPPSWAWRGLADLVLFIDYRGQTPNKVSRGVRLITAKNVKRGYINVLPEEFLSEPDYHTWMTRGFPKPGDVLFTTEAPMGNAAVVRTREPFALAQRIIDFHPYGAIDPGFLVLQLLSAPFGSILDRAATGLTAKGIKAAKLRRLPIVVPPIAEQRRIVAKVDEVMALCDQLETQLIATQTDSSRLLEALLHRALASAA